LVFITTFYIRGLYAKRYWNVWKKSRQTAYEKKEEKEEEKKIDYEWLYNIYYY
jgi:hypothetical protein